MDYFSDTRSSGHDLVVERNHANCYVGGHAARPRALISGQDDDELEETGELPPI